MLIAFILVINNFQNKLQLHGWDFRITFFAMNVIRTNPAFSNLTDSNTIMCRHLKAVYGGMKERKPY